MTARRAAWIGAGAVVLCCLAQGLAAVFYLSSPQGWDYPTLLFLGYPIIGAVIVSQQPRNTIGWLLVVCGALISLGFFCRSIVYATLDADPTLWQEVLAWVTNIMYLGAFEGFLFAMAFLFPTGRTISARWRVAARAVLLAMILIWGFIVVEPGPLGNFFDEAPQITNPFGIPGVDTFGASLDFLRYPLGAAVMLTTLAAVVARVRQARGIERLQLQWLALAIGLAGLSFVVEGLATVLLPDIADLLSTVFVWIFFIAATLGVSAAIGIGILRYHLYDIERIVNRTLVYLTLSVLLVLVYVALILLFSGAMRALTGASGSVVTAAATLISAALFNPFRSRIQRVVDRRFYRRKYDAARMIDGFSVRVRNEVDLAALQSELQSIVVQTMQPAHVSIWLRPMDKREYI